MAKFAYNNVKNASIGYTPFKLNYDYYSKALFKEDTDLCFKSKSADKLLVEFQELIIVCRKNIYHVQELQKRAHNKGAKLRS